MLPVFLSLGKARQAPGKIPPKRPTKLARIQSARILICAGVDKHHPLHAARVIAAKIRRIPGRLPICHNENLPNAQALEQGFQCNRIVLYGIIHLGAAGIAMPRKIRQNDAKVAGKRLKIVCEKIGRLPCPVQQKQCAPVLLPRLKIVNFRADALGHSLLFLPLYLGFKADIGILSHAPVVGKPGLRLYIHIYPPPSFCRMQ